MEPCKTKKGRGVTALEMPDGDDSPPGLYDMSCAYRGEISIRKPSSRQLEKGNGRPYQYWRRAGSPGVDSDHQLVFGGQDLLLVGNLVWCQCRHPVVPVGSGDGHGNQSGKENQHDAESPGQWQGRDEPVGVAGIVVL